MGTAAAKTTPLVIVLYRLPLFVEAVAAALDGVADVQPVHADNTDVALLVEALNAQAVVVEGGAADARPVDVRAGVVHVDLEHEVAAIRAAVVAALGGARA